MKKTVLIADDSMFMRKFLKDILSDEDFIVIAEATNGEEAISYYKQFSPDVVLLDITMPIVNGIDALKQIMEYDSEANVVICSAMGQKSLIIDALAIGAKDYIIKPFFQDLNKILHNTF